MGACPSASANAAWHACFPRARSALVSWRADGSIDIPVLDADCVHFEGLLAVTVHARRPFLTDAALTLAHFEPRVFARACALNMSYCAGITDAAIVHLQDLNISFCTGITALAHLRGIHELARLR